MISTRDTSPDIPAWFSLFFFFFNACNHHEARSMWGMREVFKVYYNLTDSSFSLSSSAGDRTVFAICILRLPSVPVPVSGCNRICFALITLLNCIYALWTALQEWFILHWMCWKEMLECLLQLGKCLSSSLCWTNTRACSNVHI